jgi:hypothetical protein
VCGVVRRVAFADPGGVSEKLDDRPEGDALTVWEAAARDHGRVRLCAREELPDQPRLPHAGRPEHRDELRRAMMHRAAEDLLQAPQLRIAIDER